MPDLLRRSKSIFKSSKAGIEFVYQEVQEVHMNPSHLLVVATLLAGAVKHEKGFLQVNNNGGSSVVFYLLKLMPND